MAIFQNSFFSLEGQKERFANVGNTLLAAVGIKKGGVQSNTGVKIVDTALSAAASHPFTVAAVAATAAAPAAAASIAKSVGKAAASEFGKLSIGAKAATVVGVPVVAGAVASSRKLRTEISNAPASLVNFGANVGNLVDNPSLEALGTTIKENPAISALVGAGAVAAVGGGAVAAAQIISTRQNTAAIRESTTAAASNQALTTSSQTGLTPLAAPVVNSATKTPILPDTSLKTRGARGKYKRKKAKPSNITQTVKVYNIDDRDRIDRKVFKQRR